MSDARIEPFKGMVDCGDPPSDPPSFGTLSGSASRRRGSAAASKPCSALVFFSVI